MHQVWLTRSKRRKWLNGLVCWQQKKSCSNSSTCFFIPIFSPTQLTLLHDSQLVIAFMTYRSRRSPNCRRIWRQRNRRLTPPPAPIPSGWWISSMSTCSPLNRLQSVRKPPLTAHRMSDLMLWRSKRNQTPPQRLPGGPQGPPRSTPRRKLGNYLGSLPRNFRQSQRPAKRFQRPWSNMDMSSQYPWADWIIWTCLTYLICNLVSFSIKYIVLWFISLQLIAGLPIIKLCGCWIGQILIWKCIQLSDTTYWFYLHHLV